MKTFLNHTVKGILLFVYLTTYAICGTIDPNTLDKEYIEYAQNFDYVYKVCGTYNDGSLFCASAVAINKNWLLTAAHVVENSRTCLISKDDKAFIVTKTICHENFDATKYGIADIALLQIDGDLGLSFYPSLYDKEDEKHKLCSIAGYGMHGTFLTGLKNSDNNMRAGSNIIDDIEKDLLIVSPSRDHTKTKLEFLICSGDSGGGLFIDNCIAGINSCVTTVDGKLNSDYGDIGGHTRISKFVPWINQTIKENTTKNNPF